MCIAYTIFIRGIRSVCESSVVSSPKWGGSGQMSRNISNSSSACAYYTSGSISNEQLKNSSSPKGTGKSCLDCPARPRRVSGSRFHGPAVPGSGFCGPCRKGQRHRGHRRPGTTPSSMHELKMKLPIACGPAQSRLPRMRLVISGKGAGVISLFRSARMLLPYARPALL